MPVGGNVRGAAFALLGMGIYATHDVIIKHLGGIYPAFQNLFFASLLSLPMMTALMLNDESGGTLRPAHPAWLALRTACIVVAGVTNFYAFSVLPLAQVYVLLFMQPLLVTILSIPILGERVGAHRWGAVALGLIGVLIVLRPGQAHLGLGHLGAATGAVCGATASVILRRIGKDERTETLILWPMLGNLLLTGALLTTDYRPMELNHLAMTGIIAVLGLIAGFLMILAYRSGEAGVVAPMQYSQILWATFYGWLIFGETLDLPTAIGAATIIASGIYIIVRESRRGISSSRPVTEARVRTETVTTPKSTLLSRLLSRI